MTDELAQRFSRIERTFRRRQHPEKKSEADVDFAGARSSPCQKAVRGDPPGTTTGRTTMRLMVIVKASKNSEAGILPSEKLLSEMGKYNEELVKAGIMVAGDGLQPSAKGKRIVLGGGGRRVVDGPFAETKELVAGYWIWQVKSMEEALAWAQRCPDPMPGEEAVLELRPLFEVHDFGDNATPEVRERDARLRAELGKRGN
jgi:hypothetical protein